MAKLLLLLLLVVFASVLTSSASARLLNGHLTLLLENPSESQKQQVLPCHTNDSNIQASAAETPRFGAAAAAKYGPLILNLLPKGTKPPSGPSKGTNDLNN
ncbi:hypothetical protein ACFX13_042337 [Malus domestica]|uniref:Uncharacterized protein n=1 Tax=Malus domestica TaxID=3750 RepID=A0A498JGD2_MALDO|nr:uncharacterized protein LOC103432907 [Malus domestica]RXH94738.1 hypothetical protein DVH24_024422 [Malus domestica]